MQASSEDAGAAGPGSVSGRVIGTVMVTLILGLVGFVLAYVMALVVVKIGIGGPKLFVGMPLVAVGGLAWLTSAGTRPIGARVLEIVVAGGLAAALIGLVQPGHPAGLLEHRSEVTDVEVHGDDATVTFANETRLSVMPPAGRLLALTMILAGLAVAGSAIGRCLTPRPPELE